MSRWMNQLGGPVPGGNGQSTVWLPAVDVWETEEELVLSFDLPGIEEEKISVEVDDSVLTVSGEREKTDEYSGERFYRFERRYGTFQRSVTLPAGADESKIKAAYTNGVLEVRVPKPEEAKPKRIQIGDKGAIEGEAKRAG
jgi:HSP20 family protein